MKITYDIPDREWYQLARYAEERGLKITTILNTAFRELLTKADHAPDTITARVHKLVDRGEPDAVIAMRLGLNSRQVAEIRRGLGLQPNKLRREQWSHVLEARAAA
ncbi:hypothetical protein [Microbacterium sp. LWH11-1.2]|uniref:hypothetical protein n=1 Tax=Microbacterium sp. LWH11-1.2 TaxID=3135258 RepID=UPI0031392EF1